MAASVAFLDLLKPLHPIAPPPKALPPGEPDRSARSSEQAAEAQILAAEILARAQHEAEALLEDARVQADTLREAAWQEGFHDGQTTGRSAMEMTLRDEWEAEKRALRAQIQDLVTEIGTAREALWQRQEAEMVAFVLTIARQVIKTEVAQNPEIVRNIIQNALRRVTDKEHVRIRVSLSDAARVRTMRDELMAMTDGLRQLEILDDRRVGDGGCVIETGAGTIDAKIETQLAEVERALCPLAATPNATRVDIASPESLSMEPEMADGL
jgi:flagellar assembly protein FliH